MKNALRLLAIAALATTFALPAFAQDTTATGTAAATTAQDAEAKAALYKKFLDNYKGTPDQQKVAFESGREYLTKYSGDTSAENAPIVKFIQNWTGKYEKAVVEFNCTKAVNETPAQAFQVCRDILASNPDNLKIRLALVGAGIKSYSTGNKSLNAQAASEARTALQLIEQGKTSETYAPFASQQDAPMGLRYYIAAWSLETAPEETVTQLLKVAQSNSIFAKEPATFQLLGAAYYNGELKKLADEYKRLYEGKEETPESKALFDRVNVVLDRVIDAYARAVALSNANPSKYGATATALRPVLTNLYKQRHENSEAGLNELIASILNKPLPIPGQEPAPTAVPSSTSGMSGTNGAATTQPASAQPAGATAKPAASTNTTPAPKPATPAQRPPRS